MLNLRERKRDLSRTTIIAAAQGLLAEKGYTAMNMDDVSARAGISKATLYQYFRSKDELCVQVIARDIEHMAAFGAALDPARPAIERLRAMLREGLHRRYAYSAASLPSFLPAAVWDNPQFAAQREHAMAASSGLLEAATAEGDIRADLPLAAVGALIASIFVVDTDALTRQTDLTSEEVCDALLDGLFHGIGARTKTRHRLTKGGPRR